MEITSPASLHSQIDMEIWNRYKDSTRHEKNVGHKDLAPTIACIEPNFKSASEGLGRTSSKWQGAGRPRRDPIRSKVVLLGDFIDTDALTPSEFLLSATSDEALGEHCLQHTNPDFREKVKSGQRVVVAGKAFGVGSSRETAPRALLGTSPSFRSNSTTCVVGADFADQD